MGSSDASKVVAIPHDISFNRLKEIIYATFGCTDCKLKPDLTYKIGVRGYIYSLTDTSDFLSLMASKELTAKKGDMKVFILISTKVRYHFIFIFILRNLSLV